MMGFGFGGGLSGLGWGLSMLLSMLLPVVVLVGIIYLVLTVWDRGRRNAMAGGPEPVALLQRRYAKGEITKEEYQRVKEELNQ
ncbi:putative membrane protein [Desulfotomaculum arcticum]|uniref:Putative membrane protein n=1 Tax=Desulfotruncus arcticus DSM 17038 TaxID=1121424 RepID=A0A1I2UIP6_9FIRM|nr:SHOCT domain-containing protein [Desulfotruncus arcticus]SFG77022.1 putative membrane protein [Desulfotomaculum arcticum] [Desulfotruncus arcticus DSM 17038]